MSWGHDPDQTHDTVGPGDHALSSAKTVPQRLFSTGLATLQGLQGIFKWPNDSLK